MIGRRDDATESLATESLATEPVSTESGATEPELPPAAGLAALDHLLERLPTEIRASLNEAQLGALAAATRQPAADHLLDYRISVRWLRRRYYVRVLTGHERRTMKC